MKIAFVTDNDRYSWIWRQNYALYDWLKKQWVDIDLINLYIPVRFKWEPEWKQIKSNMFNNYYLSLFYGIIYIFPNKLKKLLKNWGYTHVILGHQFMSYLYPALSKINIKRIIIIHDLCLLYKEKKDVWDIIYTKLLMKDLDKYENLAFISDFTKNDYIKYYNNLENKNYKTIYQWIDKQRVNNELRETLMKKYNLQNKKVFINVWSEDPRKNIITYLKIAEYYKNRNDIIFIRVWKKSQESENYIKEHKINNILYLKWLSDEELIALYNLSDAVISTSLYEWYGRQIFEWYLYSKYTITSDVSDIKKIFEWDNSVCIIDNPNNTEEFCKSINKLLQGDWKKKTTRIQHTKKETAEYYDFCKITN